MWPFAGMTRQRKNCLLCLRLLLNCNIGVPFKHFIMACHCFVDVNECSSDPCQNGANCSTPAINVFSCQCEAGYTGELCETGKCARQFLLLLLLLIIKYAFKRTLLK